MSHRSHRRRPRQRYPGVSSSQSLSMRVVSTSSTKLGERVESTSSQSTSHIAPSTSASRRSEVTVVAVLVDAVAAEYPGLSRETSQGRRRSQSALHNSRRPSWRRTMVKVPGRRSQLVGAIAADLRGWHRGNVQGRRRRSRRGTIAPSHVDLGVVQGAGVAVRDRCPSQPISGLHRSTSRVDVVAVDVA